MHLNNVRNRHKNIINILIIIGVVFSLWSCQGTNMMMDRQLQESVNVTDCQMQNLQGIEMKNLATIPPNQQEMHLEQIAKWYYSAWGKYASIGPESEHWKIPKSELIEGQLPITVIACDTTDTTKDLVKLVAVARLKNDNDVEDGDKVKIFPEGTYRLSGLYVDEHYRGRGIGRAITQEILSLAVQDGAQFFGFFSHPKKAQKVYEHWGFPLHDIRKIHNKEAAIYLTKNPSFMLRKLSERYAQEGEEPACSVDV